MFIGVVQELVNVPLNSGAKKVVVDVNLKVLKYGSYIFFSLFWILSYSYIFFIICFLISSYSKITHDYFYFIYIFNRGKVILCGLWESYATKFLNYYNQNKNCGAIVLILTHAMIRDKQVFFLNYNNHCYTFKHYYTLY